MSRTTNERPPIKVSLRFEVFKRDSFKCQYCGASAPEAILHVDHVKPRADGGTEDLLNLITACSACNLGKGSRPISDSSVVTKQRQQLEELNERRQQLEMMIQWQQELADMKSSVADRIAEYWGGLTMIPRYQLNEGALAKLRKLLRRFSPQEVMEAMQIAADQYFDFKDGTTPTEESVTTAWHKIGGVCRVEQLSQKDPHARDVYYIVGILRNRFDYVNKGYALQLLQKAMEMGTEREALVTLASSSRHWTEWREGMEECISEEHGVDG